MVKQNIGWLFTGGHPKRVYKKSQKYSRRNSKEFLKKSTEKFSKEPLKIRGW